MNRPTRPLVTLLTTVCVTLLPACYDWHVTDVAPGRYIAEEQPAIVRLTLIGGQSVDIENPSIASGSIVGVLGTRGRGRPMVDSTVSVPVDDVTQVEVRELSKVRTGAGLAFIATALAVTVSRVFSNWVHR